MGSIRYLVFVHLISMLPSFIKNSFYIFIVSKKITFTITRIRLGSLNHVLNSTTTDSVTMKRVWDEEYLTSVPLKHKSSSIYLSYPLEVFYSQHRKVTEIFKWYTEALVRGIWLYLPRLIDLSLSYYSFNLRLSDASNRLITDNDITDNQTNLWFIHALSTNQQTKYVLANIHPCQITNLDSGKVTSLAIYCTLVLTLDIDQVSSL